MGILIATWGGFLNGVNDSRLPGLLLISSGNTLIRTPFIYNIHLLW